MHCITSQKSEGLTRKVATCLFVSSASMFFNLQLEMMKKVTTFFLKFKWSWSNYFSFLVLHRVQICVSSNTFSTVKVIKYADIIIPTITCKKKMQSFL